MAEAIEGTVSKCREGKYGWGMQIEGRADWFNEKKNGPTLNGYAQGDRVKVELWQSDKGNLYVEGIVLLSKAKAATANGNGGTPPTGFGSFAFKDASIMFEVCLREAREFQGAGGQSSREDVIETAALWFMRGVQLVKAETAEPVAAEQKPDPEYNE